MTTTDLRHRLLLAWLERLEADAYPQATGHLSQRIDGTLHFCALGVACEVYQELVGPLQRTFDDQGIAYYEGDNWRLPEVVLDAFGFHDGEEDRLLEANDEDHLTFPEIAALAREELLFEP